LKALIKIGGTLLDSPQSRSRLASEIGSAIENGLRAAVVHGGGKQMTRFLADRGVESQFVNGLRVTTPDVLDAVLKVLAGSVNQELVAAFVAAGVKAVGLTGMDGLITEARQMSEEMGAVGTPTWSDARLLNLLQENSYLPVIACVAGDRQGRFYNVNADQMATSLGLVMKVNQLIFLTDVDGVRDQNNVIRNTLSIQECRSLIRAGIATGGMQAKLNSAIAALEGGIDEVVIAPGAQPGIIENLTGGERVGTRLVSAIGVENHG